ncbi:MAG: hypothetical protein QM752_00145 [Gammaproteobacteria bacterium]
MTNPNISLPNETKILRFLDEPGLLHTLGISKDLGCEASLTPSFLLRSLEHYRKVESDKGDPREQKIVNSLGTDANLNPCLISSWSCYSENDLNNIETWKAFPSAVAAVESTVLDVQNIINDITTNNPLVNFNGRFNHGRIHYYAPGDNHVNEIYKGPAIVFVKEKKFEKEQEYRFAVLFNAHQKFSVDSYSVKLSSNGRSYITKIYINTEKLLDIKRKLVYYQRKLSFVPNVISLLPINGTVDMI